MKNPNHFLIGLFLSCFLFFSCGSENSEELNAPENQTFSDPIQVEFGFTSLRTAEGSSAASKGNVQSSKSQTTSLTTDAASILISINGSNGESIYENHKIDLVRVGDDILSLPLSFTATGTYYVTLFQVLDENNIALAMTPRENSELSSAVSTTLDHEFLIDIDSTNRVNLEVVLLNNTLEAADFGYSTFSFVEIDLNPFLIGVFTYDEITSNFELTASTVTVTHHDSNHVVHNQPHDDATITIYIPTYEDDELFTIEVGSPGFKTHTSSHTFAELLNHFDPVPQGAGPMIITLDLDAIEGFFKAITYTGNSGTQSITGVGFQPDLVWIKSVNSIYNHIVYDSIRGEDYSLSPNLNGVSRNNLNRFTSFDEDGFSIYFSNAADYYKINRVGVDFVAWCWKAGGPAVTNNDGSIASQVSANPAAGFSIVTYTGVGYPASSTAEIGHGLDAAPELVIIKGTGGTGQSGGVGSWVVGSSLLGAGWEGSFYLNSANGYYNAINYFWNGNVTGSVIKLKNDFFVNGSNNQYVAYCFHSVAGVSKVGSYTGASGNNIPLDFEASFFLVKRTDAVGDWIMIDNARSPANPRNEILKANLANAETANSTLESVNFNSNGIEIVSTGANINASGGSYIYLAIK